MKFRLWGRYGIEALGLIKVKNGNEKKGKKERKKEKRIV